MRKYVIFGCCSYFARNFSYYLKMKEGSVGGDRCQIVGVDILDNVEPHKNIYLDEFIKFDLTKIDYNLTQFNNHIIINFASLSHVDESYKNPIHFWENNTGIALTLSMLKPSKGIHISTDEVISHTNPYSKSKLKQEEILENTNWLIVRPNNLYSSFNENCLPTQNTLWNVLRKQEQINLVESACKIKRCFLPVQIACEELWKIVHYSTKKINEIYFGREMCIMDMILEYEKKYKITHIIQMVKDRPETDYSYPKGKEISHLLFVKYL